MPGGKYRDINLVTDTDPAYRWILFAMIYSICMSLVLAGGENALYEAGTRLHQQLEALFESAGEPLNVFNVPRGNKRLLQDRIAPFSDKFEKFLKAISDTKAFVQINTTTDAQNYELDPYLIKISAASNSDFSMRGSGVVHARDYTKALSITNQAIGVLERVCKATHVYSDAAVVADDCFEVILHDQAFGCVHGLPQTHQKLHYLKLHDRAVAEAYGNVMVQSIGSVEGTTSYIHNEVAWTGNGVGTLVVCYDESHASAQAGAAGIHHDQSYGTYYGIGTTAIALDDSRIYLYNGAKGTCSGNSYCYPYAGATVFASEQSKVVCTDDRRTPGQDHTIKIEAHGNSLIQTCDTAKIVAYDQSVIHFYGGNLTVSSPHVTVVVFKSGDIYVTKSGEACSIEAVWTEDQWLSGSMQANLHIDKASSIGPTIYQSVGTHLNVDGSATFVKRPAETKPVSVQIMRPRCY